MKTLHKDITQDKGRQSLMGTYIVQDDDHKLKATIKRNAYDFQSYATVDRWNGEEWKRVVSFDILKLEIAHYSYLTNDPYWKTEMAACLNYMIADTQAILA